MSRLFACDYLNLKLENIPNANAKMISSSKALGKRETSKCIAEWIDEKFKSFVCSALKPSPQKNWLKKAKYTFDLTMCGHILDVLLGNNFIRIIDHQVVLSPHNQEHTHCMWRNSFDTSNCNVLRQVIQSVIDEERLRLSEAQQMNQSELIGFNGKKVSNRPRLADLLKAQGSEAKQRDMEPFSKDKVIVLELQIGDIIEDNKVVTTPENIGGASKISPIKAKAD